MARDYGTVGAGIWTGKTGKSIRGDMHAQVMAFYLMTCSHAQMTGIYYLPMMYAGHETGMGIEGAWKGLKRLIEEGFCEYDEESEFVFVVNLAREQVGHELKLNDKRAKGIEKQLASCSQKGFVARFLAIYADAYNLSESAVNPIQNSKGLGRGIEAPSKPGTGTGTGTGEKKCPKPKSRFMDFWEVWPKKQAKADAEKAWKSKQLDNKADEIIADVVDRKHHHRPWLDGFTPLPATYLRGERWDDEIEGRKQQDRSEPKELPLL